MAPIFSELAAERTEVRGYCSIRGRGARPDGHGLRRGTGWQVIYRPIAATATGCDYIGRSVLHSNARLEVASNCERLVRSGWRA